MRSRPASHPGAIVGDATLRVVVTGGAGFLGVNLIRHLLRLGHQVTSLDIAAFEYPDVRDRVVAVRADVRDAEAVERAMAGADLVVHGAAALPLHARRDIFSIEVQGTRNVLDAARRHGVARVIHISSTAVYGTTIACPHDEATPFDAIGPYAEAKVEAEMVCREFRRRGLCVPVLRPKTFVGPERLGIFAILYKWVREGRGLPVIGRGDNRYQLLDVTDLCEAIVQCATREAWLVNDDFNVGATRFGTVRQDLQALLDFAGLGGRVRPLPAAPIVLGLRILERLRLSPIYRWVYETAAADSTVSTARAEQTLGFQPRFSNQEALIRNYQWYCDHLPGVGATGVSHRAAWNEGLLGLARRLF
jgi:nucleoside-diphosphate-sugar epimerase